MKRKTAFDGQNERDQYLTRQPLDVLRVEERNIILLCALKATTVGMLVIIEPQHLNAFNMIRPSWDCFPYYSMFDPKKSPQTYGTTWPFQWMMLHPVIKLVEWGEISAGKLPRFIQSTINLGR